MEKKGRCTSDSNCNGCTCCTRTCGDTSYRCRSFGAVEGAVGVRCNRGLVF